MTTDRDKDKYHYGKQTLHDVNMDTVPIFYGKGVRIKNGAIIGGEGFGYDTLDDGSYLHQQHNFGVKLEDNVHIGSCCCVDRGKWRDTIIGEGTITDNLVHVAHNVIVGKNCQLRVGSILLGSCEIGDNTKIMAHAVIHQKVKIGKNCVIGANSYVRHDVPDNQVWYGSPARFIRMNTPDASEGLNKMAWSK